MIPRLEMARLLIVEDNAELAALVESAVRTRGHTARRVGTGGAALSAIDEEAPELAIVDLLLPDLSGRDVLVRLKERAIPAIAVSGVYKGDRFAQETTQVLGARAFFQKPFEMLSLLDAVDRIAGVAQAPADEEDDLEELEVLSPIEDEDEDEQDEPLLPVPPKLPPEEPLTPIVQVSPEALREERITPPPQEQGPEPDLQLDPHLARTPARGTSLLPDEARADVSLPFARRDAVWEEREAPRKARAATPDWSQAGALRTTSVPRLLTAYYQAGHRGELKLRSGQIVKVVYFEEGQPVYAASNVAAERFGRFCVRHGALTEPQLAQVAQKAKAESLRTFEAMLALGLLTPERRAALLSDQVREIIWSTFGWKDGEYAFAPKRPARGDLVKIRVFPGDLILEGVQRTETLVSLRQKMPAARRLYPTADPAYALNELKLSGAQALLVAYADGSKTVEDLVALTDLSEKEALATLLGFELLGVLQERREEDKRRRISFGL